MISRRLLLTTASAFALVVRGQPTDYADGYYEQDYSQDGLYANYAKQQEAKEVGAKT